MELLQKYWWVLLIVAAGMLFLSRRSSGAAAGGAVQQIGGADTSQLAAIASSEYQQAEQSRVGLIGALLGYQQGQDNLAASERINTANNAANITIAQYTGATNQSAINAQLSAAQLAAANQAAAVAAANAQNSRNSWLTGITSGLGALTPLLGGLLGGSSTIGTSNGGWGGIFSGGGTPGFNPNSGWGSWW